MWRSFIIVYLCGSTLLLISAVYTYTKFKKTTKAFGIKIVISYIVLTVANIISMILLIFIRQEVNKETKVGLKLWITNSVYLITTITCAIAGRYILWNFGFYYYKVG